MDKLLIPRKETAQLLSISVDMLDSLRRLGEIKCVRIGARVYFTPEELQAFTAKSSPLS